MPYFKVNAGDCIIKAKNKEDAISGYAIYIHNDLGMECFEVKQVKRDEFEQVDYEN